MKIFMNKLSRDSVLTLLKMFGKTGVKKICAKY